MTYMLGSIDEAIDRKFLITRNMTGQAEAGHIVHIMGAEENGGGIVVYYRITSTGQDYNVKFESLKQFCQWARPDNFIARYYESLSLEDIQKYIKVKNRTFVSFCLPFILVALVIIWAVCMLVIKGIVGIAVAAVLSLLVSFLIVRFNKTSKTKAMTRLYSKVSSSWAGGGIVIS